jgi:hypothetical protein
MGPSRFGTLHLGCSNLTRLGALGKLATLARSQL